MGTLKPSAGASKPHLLKVGEGGLHSGCSRVELAPRSVSMMSNSGDVSKGD